MTNNNSQSKAGTGVVGVVQIVFIILKLTKTGTISNWPWWMVMLPFICTLGLVCCCSLTACCCGIICAPYLSEKKDTLSKVDIENQYEAPPVITEEADSSSPTSISTDEASHVSAII